MTTITGRVCPKCSRTERYASSKACVTCSIEKARAKTAEYRKKRARANGSRKESTAPQKLLRPRGWPRFENEYGETVMADPIWVKAEKGEDIGRFE